MIRVVQLCAMDWTTDGMNNPESDIYGANMGPTWVLTAPDRPHVGPINLAIRESLP